MDLNTFSVDELKALRSEVSAELKARRENALETERKAKSKREAEFKGSVAEGDTIKFRFNKKEMVADAVRASDKSVTVEIDGAKKYVKYANILEVVSEADEADEATDETEAVA